MNLIRKYVSTLKVWETQKIGWKAFKREKLICIRVSVVSNPICIEMRTVWRWIYKKTRKLWVDNHTELDAVSEMYAMILMYTRTLHELKYNKETPKNMIHGMVIWRQGQVLLYKVSTKCRAQCSSTTKVEYEGVNKCMEYNNIVKDNTHEVYRNYADYVNPDCSIHSPFGPP